jgi:hypothetical protein
MGYGSLFLKWANKYNLSCNDNKQTFPLHNGLSYQPEYIINNKIYIDIYEDSEITTDYYDICEAFKNRHAPIILIPKDSLSYMLNNITPEDIEKKFDIKF